MTWNNQCVTGSDNWKTSDHGVGKNLNENSMKFENKQGYQNRKSERVNWRSDPPNSRMPSSYRDNRLGVEPVQKVQCCVIEMIEMFLDFPLNGLGYLIGSMFCHVDEEVSIL